MKRLKSKIKLKIQNAWCSLLLFFVFSLIIFLMILPVRTFSQVTGLWKSVGDIDGDEKAIIEIYEQDNKLYGKVIRLLPAARHTTCERCEGDLKNSPITGMVVLQNLTITPTGGEKGKVLDPSSGRIYNCYIELVSKEKLKLRGYLAVPALGRTQYWYKVSI